MDKKSTSEILSWFHSFFATLVSVLLGVSVAMYLFNIQQENKAKSDKERLLSLLSLELTRIQHILKDSKRSNLTLPGGQIVKLQIISLESVILEQAGKSGLFNASESFMMLDLTGSIRNWNRKTEGLQNSINSSSGNPNFASRINWYIENIDKSRSGILTGTTLLSKELKISLNKKVKEYF